MYKKILYIIFLVFGNQLFAEKIDFKSANPFSFVDIINLINSLLL